MVILVPDITRCGFNSTVFSVFYDLAGYKRATYIYLVGYELQTQPVLYSAWTISRTHGTKCWIRVRMEEY